MALSNKTMLETWRQLVKADPFFNADTGFARKFEEWLKTLADYEEQDDKDKAAAEDRLFQSNRPTPPAFGPTVSDPDDDDGIPF